MDVRFALAGITGAYTVRPITDGIERQPHAFELDLAETSSLNRYVAAIERGQCKIDDFREVGDQLWTALAPLELREEISSVVAADESTHVTIRIDLPLSRELEMLPWESVLDSRTNTFLACSARYSVVRTPPRDVSHPAWRRVNRGPIRVLVIVPEGSQLDVTYECNNMRRLATALGPVIDLGFLPGRVTIDALDNALSQGKWDVIHYIGHGESTVEGAVAIRLNDETPRSERWLDALTFAQLIAEQHIQLAVLNCCLGAAPSGSRTLSGCGPHLSRTARVPAIVAMRYEITDPDSTRFADVFYRELLLGDRRGRVDFATQITRRSLLLNSNEITVRGFVTPVLFVEPGREQLFDIAVVPANEPPRKRRKISSSVPLPARLISAFAEKRCIPIIGTNIHTGEATRRAPTAETETPTLLDLVRSIAIECEYPELAEIEFAGTSAEGLVVGCMSRVFQHYQSRYNRFGLVSRVVNLCPRASIPEVLLAIAAWDTHGFIYTHFDGLMEQALIQARKQPCTVNIIKRGGPASKVAPLLLNLRGSVTERSSLVLTDADHEDRFDLLVKGVPDVVDLLSGESGRSLLLLGVSPRDALVRRLCAQHLDCSEASMQEPPFFVSNGEHPVDRSYWQRFKVEWIHQPLGAVVDRLTAAADDGQ